MPHEPSLNRERILQRTGAELARACTVDEIGTIVRKAGRDLIGELPGGEALFAMRRADRLTVVATSSGRLAPSSKLASLVPHVLPRLRLLEPGEPQLVRVTGLGPEEKAAAIGAAFESILLCPLALPNQPAGDPLVGLIAAGGERRMLVGMSPALGILANLVTLALERIVLSVELVRQRGEALFRTLVQDALDVILVLGDDGIIKCASPSATRLFGDIPIDGARADSLTADFEQVMTHPVSGPDASTDAYAGPYQITRRDGRRLCVEARFTDLRHDETVQGRVLTIRDVTEQHQLKYQALHDTLTGLPNRALFTDRAEHAITLAQRNRTVAAVLFIDLDDFKVVNDTMGHAVGDELLTGAAERLARVARESDTAARLGGDEFALLIENLQDSAAVEGFADRAVATFSAPFELSSGSVLAGATVGVATTQDSSDVRELLQHADLSLYAAKSEGKRRWRQYEPALSAAINKRREMQEKLEDALARSAFTLAYQPIVELDNGAIHALEAQVRWPQRDVASVPTEEFVELAEETGLIIPLGWWILKQAITDTARWRGTNPDPQQPKICINVSARQFRDPGFVAGLRQCLHDRGLVASTVTLELTERSLLRRDERITSALRELKDIGVRLVIDDFGTGSGYSSPALFRELPILALKIDKSYVDAITEAQGRKFAEVIIDFARAIEADVIAQGIETEEQRARLTEMGCRLGQGNLLAAPMNAHAAERLLRSGRPLTHLAPSRSRGAAD